MKNAFAKLMEKNPVQSSTEAFRAGGNGVPILTRASGQSTTGYQTMGLPSGSKPMPGGGANKTTLGNYRMGETDGTSPPSAIIGNPGDIFPPNPPTDRNYPERTFANVGNNVYQPINDDSATLALLKRLGDQQFKATTQAPFEDYRAQQRFAKDLDEASRNASISDVGTSREIMRNLAAQRRQQNEDDYLRRMLDSGATPEAAQKEIQDVRNANALQEARKVDDRDYQAKTLIQRMAMARGITPMVRESLQHSSSIDNPQASQAMSQAMGKPGEGFGTSPLDMNRQFMTPEFYRRFSRKSALTQESADEQTAFNQLLTGSAREGSIQPTQSGYSMATLQGQQRQNQVDLASEGLAARLETIRNRANKISRPLPPNLFAKDVIDKIYTDKNKKKGDASLYSLETIQDMRPLQLLIALNLATIALPNGFTNLYSQLNGYSFGNAASPSPTILTDLQELVVFMNQGESNIRIPFASSSMAISMPRLATIMEEIKSNRNNEALRRETDNAHKQYVSIMENMDNVKPNVTQKLSDKLSSLSRSTLSELPSMTAAQEIAERPIPGAPNRGTPFTDAIRRGMRTNLERPRNYEAPAAAPPADNYDTLKVPQLKVALAKAKLPVSGTKAELIARLRLNK
jgi:hypothetical protein